MPHRVIGMFRQCSRLCHSMCKNKILSDSRIRNFNSFNRSKLNFNRSKCVFVESNFQPIRCLGFQTYFTEYIKKTLKHIFQDFGAALLRSKRLFAFSFQSHYRKSSYIQYELVDLKLLQTSNQECWI